jgi:hypothetical protein
MQPTQVEGRAYIRKGYEIINEDYDNVIKQCFVSKKFENYCIKKFKWKGNTYKMVNWKALNHEAKKLNINRRTNLLKYVYDWLPIGNILKHIDPLASTSCPSCGAQVESPSHIFCCRATERQDITTSCIEAITEINNKWKVNTILTREIRKSLYNWTKSPSIRPSFDSIDNTQLRQILETQSSIGWGNFLKGLISIRFEEEINIQRNKQLNHFEEIRWTCEIIRCIWDHEESHWKTRNGDKHGHNPVESSAIVRERLLSEATELYNLRSEVPQQYRKMFPSWNQLVKRRNGNLESWVNTTRKSIQYLLDVNSQPDDDPDSATA